MTSPPRRARPQASAAPNVPAPTITTRSIARDATTPGMRSVATGLAIAALTGAAAQPAGAAVIGHSARGRAIVATRVGAADAPVRVLVVGDVHGNEPAGEAIVARLRRGRPRGGGAGGRGAGQPGRGG